LITLSTYTEPQPQLLAVTETAQVYEPEESNETSEFAELLAGMLKKNGNDEAAQDVQLADFSGVELEGLNLEKSDAGEKLNLFSEIEENGKVLKREFPKTRDLEDGLSETELSQEQSKILSGAENLLARFEPVVEDAGSDELAHETLVKAAGDLSELEQAADFSHFTEAAQTDGLEEAASLSAQEAMLADAKNKKERAQLNFENDEVPASANSRSEETASLRAAQEKDNALSQKPGKLEEARNRTRRDKVSFEVRDLRSAAGAEVQKNAPSLINVGADTSGRMQGASREITLELRLPDQGQSLPQTSWEAKAGNALENMLARELHQNFNGDIVRHASMALRDGGEGTIKLALKPESLGNVKIRLEMIENRITGHIVVESEEALNAFRKEIASLEQAFRDSGFTNADLNLSMTAEDRNASGGERDASSPSPNLASSRYGDSLRDVVDENLTPAVDVYFGRKQGSVNMLA